MWRATAAAIAFAAAAISGVLAGLMANDKSLGLWTATGTLIIIGAVLQGIVTIAEPKRRVAASGRGSVAVGGNSSAAIQTQAQRDAQHKSEPDGDITASGSGSVAIGGDSSGTITTNVNTSGES